MNKETILNIDVCGLLQKSLGSFGDIYCRLAILQNRLEESDNLLSSEKKQLAADYEAFRAETARRVENTRQMIYKRTKYEAWYQEIKSFYESLPADIGI